MRPLLTLVRDSAVESTIFQVLNCVGIFALPVVLTCLQQKPYRYRYKGEIIFIMDGKSK